MIIYGHRYETPIPDSSATGPPDLSTDTAVTAVPGDKPTCDAFSHGRFRRHDDLEVRYERNNRNISGSRTPSPFAAGQKTGRTQVGTVRMFGLRLGERFMLEIHRNLS